MRIKDWIREALIFLHLDVTQNLKYDRLTRLIMKRVIKVESNCIDIGCHKGEMLDTMLLFAPNGKHTGFEPIPTMYDALVKKYSNKATIYPFALSDANGTTTFQFVKNAPAYSGIKQRKYDIEHPEIEQIEVTLKTLDSVIDPNERIDFVKIDVEGAEFGVLKGGINLLKKNKPTIVFEFGMGASDYYGTDPIALYQFITQELGLKIFTLLAFVNHEAPLTEVDFKNLYETNKEYYFIAHL